MQAISDARSPGSVAGGEAAAVVHLDGRPPEKKRLGFADGFRALASFSVVLGHVMLYSTMRPKDFQWITSILTAFGTCGVACFFILSGVLLARPYIDGLLAPVLVLPSWRRYAARRFFLIYPLYAIAVIFSAFGPWLHGHRFPVTFLVTHLTFSHGFFVDQSLSAFNTPLWTMAVDVQFYVLLPFLMLGLAAIARNRSPRARIAVIALSFAGIALLSIVERAFVFTHIPGITEHYNVAVVYACNVFGIGASFALGMGLALIMRVAPPPSIAAARAAIVIGVGIGCALAPIDMAAASLPAQITYDALSALAVAFAMYGVGRTAFARYRRPMPLTIRFDARPGRRSVATRLAIGLAYISYPFYLFHWPIMLVCFDVTLHYLHLAPATALCAVVIVAMTLVVTLLAATLASIAVEAVQRVVQAPRWRSVWSFAPEASSSARPAQVERVHPPLSVAPHAD